MALRNPVTSRPPLEPRSLVFIGSGRDVEKPSNVPAAPRTPKSSIGSGRDVGKTVKVRPPLDPRSLVLGAGVALRKTVKVRPPLEPLF